MSIFYIIFTAWNVFVMLLYGADKIFAKKDARRISENTLIASAFLLGGTGAMFGMFMFRHKTAKLKFRILVPVAVILNIIFLLSLNYFI